MIEALHCFSTWRFPLFIFRILLIAVTTFSTLSAKPNIVLFNDTSAWYHWGCTGTSTALKEGIENIGFEIQAIPINVTYALKEVPPFDEFDDSQKFDRFCEANPDTVKAIQNAEAVVITGEGTIHDLRVGPKSLLYLAHISKKYFSKHVEIINHSAYPKDDPELSDCFLRNFAVEKERVDEELTLAQSIYKKIYSELDFVAIREPFSREAMRKINISSVLSFDCLPLFIRDHYHTKKRVNQKTAVIAGSVAFTGEGATQICRYIEHLESAGFEIKILTGAAAFPANDDVAFVDYLKSHCQAKWEHVIASSMEEWLDAIHDAAFLVSGRFHHSIAAFCLNTPFIALNSNTHKVHAICDLLEQETPLHFSDPDLLGKLLSKTKAVSKPVDNRAKIAEICELAVRNFEGLKILINESSVLERQQ